MISSWLFETFFVNRKGFEKRSGYGHKMAIMSLVERGGPIRSVVLDRVTRPTVEKIIRRNVHHESQLMTDSAGYYKARTVSAFQSMKLSTTKQGEYAHGDVHVNTLEGFYSHLQARYERRVPALQREASAPLRL